MYCQGPLGAASRAQVSHSSISSLAQKGSCQAFQSKTDCAQSQAGRPPATTKGAGSACCPSLEACVQRTGDGTKGGMGAQGQQALRQRLWRLAVLATVLVVQGRWQVEARWIMAGRAQQGDEGLLLVPVLRDDAFLEPGRTETSFCGWAERGHGSRLDNKWEKFQVELRQAYIKERTRYHEKLAKLQAEADDTLQAKEEALQELKDAFKPSTRTKEKKERSTDAEAAAELAQLLKSPDGTEEGGLASILLEAMQHGEKSYVPWSSRGRL